MLVWMAWRHGAGGGSAGTWQEGRRYPGARRTHRPLVSQLSQFEPDGHRAANAPARGSTGLLAACWGATRPETAGGRASHDRLPHRYRSPVLRAAGPGSRPVPRASNSVAAEVPRRCSAGSKRPVMIGWMQFSPGNAPEAATNRRAATHRAGVRIIAGSGCSGEVFVLQNSEEECGGTAQGAH